MTSNPAVPAPSRAAFPLRFTKVLCRLLQPVFWIVALFAGILCFFRSAPGGNARAVALVTLVVSLAAALGLYFLDRSLTRGNEDYRVFEPKALNRFNPGVTVPLVLMVFVVALPFYILLITSFKTPLESLGIEFHWWPKEGFDFTSYRQMLSYDAIIGVSMGRAIINSFVYAIIPTLVGLFVSALSAYGFAKLEFPFRKGLYMILIMTIMMPGCVTMTTSYMMYNWYGWVNTPLPLIVPACFGGAATVMFLREFYMGIPNGLLEAARIDGAGNWKNFFYIMLPLGRPALMAQFILGFITKYNDYLGPLIYLNDPDGYTIQVALDMINVSAADKSLVATAGVFSLAPMLLLYVVFQNKIINGISMSSGLKG